MEYLGLNILKISHHWARSSAANVKYYLKHALPNREGMKKTQSLRGSQSGRDAFVFSNGPSLKKLDPKKISQIQKKTDAHVFGVNSYILSDFGKIVKADHFVLSDPCHWDGRLPDSEMKHLPPEEQDSSQQTFKKEVDTLWSALRDDPGIRLFVPVHQLRQSDHPQLYPFCDSVSIYGKNVSNLMRPLNYVSMTAYKALSVACYMGYRRIYICGFDNSFFKAIHVDENNELFFSYEHAASRGWGKKYAAQGGWLTASNVGEALYNLHFAFVNINKFKAFPIVNLDPLSMINCFTKSHGLDIYAAEGEA